MMRFKEDELEFLPKEGLLTGWRDLQGGVR